MPNRIEGFPKINETTKQFFCPIVTYFLTTDSNISKWSDVPYLIPVNVSKWSDVR